jgi:glycosyltransferase involved in cell wall biosynthesis
MKNIVYIESNRDGTIGGSYYCLLEIVKHVDRDKYNPLVIFHDNNTLIPEFERYSKVIILKNKKKGLVLKTDYPLLYQHAGKYPFVKPLLTFYQKMHNLIRYVVPYYFEILSIMIKCKIDIVHLNDAPKLTEWLVASKLFGAKCISHLRGDWAATPFQTSMLKYYDRIIPISHSVASSVEKQKIDTRNFITIHDGIDIAAVLKKQHDNNAALKKEFHIPDDTCILGLIGNIKEWKGQHVAVEAMKILKRDNAHVKCLIIGAVSHLEEDKNYYEYLRKQVADYGLGDTVTFTGFRSDIPDLISLVDIIIHTSVQPEPMGRVVLEGMLFSKPVIATAHGGPREIIEDGVSGFLVPQADPQSLADKIQYLLAHHDARQRVGAAARKRVEDVFNIGSNVKAIERVYESLFGTDCLLTTC